MRILLAHNSTYYPSQGGGDVSNRLLMEQLAARGHECMVVSRAKGHRELLRELAHRDIAARVESTGVIEFTMGGVEVHTATEAPHLRDTFARAIAGFEPDAILASTDDSAQVMLEAALGSGRPVAYLARATIALPFGPDSAFPSAEKAATLRRVAGVVGVSQYVADYVKRWGAMDAVTLPISFMGAGPFANVGRFENEFVTLVNPCVVKGIDIFTALADAMPEVRFAAVPTWGANAEDLTKLRARRNIEVLPAEDGIEGILARTRVLLVPSVWAEARGRVVLEAMLRGVPVVASDTGGLPESKLGVPYVLPVNPIVGYRPSLDERMVPKAETPAQDLGPWIAAVGRLCSDAAHWATVAQASRDAALRDVTERLRIEPFEEYLLGLQKRSPGRKAIAGNESAREMKLRLIAKRLREPVFAMDTAETKVLWFPYAGSRAPMRGALTVPYPERMESMDAVVAELLRTVGPKLGGRFALFGHSMGAGIAFEFTRALRRAGLPMPFALIVSGARAPQMRTAVVDEAASEGTARYVADSGFYRRYLYREEAPLAVPIRAWCGSDDARMKPEEWGAQTTGTFAVRWFPGGHLYLNEAGDTVFRALQEVVDELLPR